MEIRFGEFRAEVALPWHAEAADVEASCEEGFLAVHLPHLKAQRVPVVPTAEAEKENR